MNLPPLAAIRCFEAAARHQSFTRAASELGITQAAMSYQIKLLEERLGPLFLRKPRGVALTETGRRLAPSGHRRLRRPARRLRESEPDRRGAALHHRRAVLRLQLAGAAARRLPGGPSGHRRAARRHRPRGGFHPRGVRCRLPPQQDRQLAGPDRPSADPPAIHPHAEPGPDREIRPGPNARRSAQAAAAGAVRSLVARLVRAWRA